jgi:N-methylhydantoinase A/oxoprolinase/acetone carboxylase beta subunit
VSYILGIDTGGTFTDGVLMDPAARQVHSTAKAFTTRQDLSVGIRNCFRKLPVDQLSQVSMVCLSTTLATNAVVEGRQSRVGLFLLGRRIDQDLPADFCIPLQGELDIKGRQRTGIDREQVRKAAKSLEGKIEAAAVSSFASVRNPIHEIQVKEILHEVLDVPVVCAHELCQSLGFYDRTVTAALNAGLITCITTLIANVKMIMKEFSLGEIPLMIVKGDGSLMKWEYALNRPVETILSGPAASVVGARFLTETKDALVVDMGGTTTDIACIRDGKARLKESGAEVGGWCPQIRAVNVSTFGIGGDSRLSPEKDGRLSIGPHRVVPLSMADRYSKVTGVEGKGKEEKGWHSALTPTDLLHASGRISRWDVKAAAAGAREMADQMHMDYEEFLKFAVNEIEEKLAAACREALKKETFGEAAAKTVIALGAPVSAWMPKVCDKLPAVLIIPPHAEVANAIGAASGSVSVEEKVLLRPDQYHERIVVHAPWGVASFESLEEAKAYAMEKAEESVRRKAECAGGERVTATCQAEEIRMEHPDTGEKQFIEMRICAVAVGSPSWSNHK